MCKYYLLKQKGEDGGTAVETVEAQADADPTVAPGSTVSTTTLAPAAGDEAATPAGQQEAGGKCLLYIKPTFY